MPEALRKFSPVMFLTLIVLISVTLLVFTESITSPIVEKRMQEQIVAKMTGMFPDVVEWNVEDDLYTLYSNEKKTDKIGYAFMATASGYSSTGINILVGLEDAQTIKGVVILAQAETPGVGSRVTEASFLDQFIGLNINDVVLKQDGGQIDSLTGATISSRAVVDTIRKTAMDRVARLEEAN